MINNIRIIGIMGVVIVLGTSLLTGCTKSPSNSKLNKSIGIVTVGDVISEIIPANQTIPHTYSETFSNAENGQQAIEITLAQKDRSGIEKICVAVIDNLPPKPIGKLNVIITIKVDQHKKLRLKATVPETGYLKEFGPVSVE